jgi:hypothetical protein
MNFLKVWTELDSGKFKSLPAKTISKNTKGVSTIQYLSSTNKKTLSGKKIYMYESETYEITDESIVQRVDSELSLGYEELPSAPGHFIKFDLRMNEHDDDDADQEDDEDYIPGTSSCEEDDDDGDDSSDWSSSDYIDEDASNDEEDPEDEDDDDGIDND